MININTTSPLPVTHSYPEMSETTSKKWLINNSEDNVYISNSSQPSVPQEDQLEGLISDATAHAIQTVLEVGILPGLVLAGVTMNIINMAVFLRQGFTDRINLCLFSLAVSDTGYILSMFVTRLHSTFRLLDPQLGQYWQLRGTCLIGVYVGFMTTSNCLTLLISLERCLLVISPLKARTMLSTRHTAVIIVLTFGACMSCLVPFGLKFDVIAVKDPSTNVTRYRPVFSQFYKDNNQIEFLFQVFGLIVPTIAFLGVIITTAAMAVRMRAVAAWRRKSANYITTSTERKEASVTRMLFVVCVMYVICSIPFFVRPVVNLLVYEFQHGMRYQNTLFATVSLTHVLFSVNSSFNFVVYFLMSTRFRDTFKELFKKGKVKKRGIGAPGHNRKAGGKESTR